MSQKQLKKRLEKNSSIQISIWGFHFEIPGGFLPRSIREIISVPACVSEVDGKGRNWVKLEEVKLMEDDEKTTVKIPARLISAIEALLEEI